MPRFQPVAVHGETLAGVIEEDRGERVSLYFLEATAFAKLFVREPGPPR